MTSTAGEVEVSRAYYRCGQCGESQQPWDDWAGICKGRLTAGCRRLASLVATGWSFDQASLNLRELCGLAVSDQTIRRVSNEEGAKAERWLDEPAAAAPVRRAKGLAEFYTDGTMFNTRGGWREMRITIFAKRKAARGVEPTTWDAVRKRRLHPPTARLATCRVASSEQMGRLWREAAIRLGLEDGRGLSALGDGAKWIWKQVGEALPGAEQLVDLYHVKEHVHQCGQVLHGAETADARSWADSQTMNLVQSGAMSYLEQLQRTADERCTSERQRQAMTALDGYLRPNINALDYAGRLRRGLPIGSGMVEGACKTVIGRRIKCNSARWLPERAEHLVALCCLRYSDLWTSYWGRAAA